MEESSIDAEIEVCLPAESYGLAALPRVEASAGQLLHGLLSLTLGQLDNITITFQDYNSGL